MAAGTKLSTSDTTTQIRNVVNDFDLISPKEVPFLRLISGGTDDTPSLNSLSVECQANKYEWVEDADMPMTWLFANMLIGDTTITVPAAVAAALGNDTIIQVESEQMRVTNATGTTTPTVSRGWAGTVAAAHTAGALKFAFIAGRSHVEGADAPSATYLYPSMPFNYVQEFTDTIYMSQIEQNIARYGIDVALEYETAKKVRQLSIMMERQCFFGIKQAPTISVPGQFGGIKSFIPSGNIVAAGGALTTTAVSNALQAVFETVGVAGMPDTIIAGAWARRKLSAIYGTTNVTTFREQNDRMGGVVVDQIQTEFGNLDVILSNWNDPSEVYLVKKDKLGFGPLRNQELTRTPLAKTGTTDKWMVNGAYTLQVRASACHAVITGVSLNS
jgi:hypothetical protein